MVKGLVVRNLLTGFVAVGKDDRTTGLLEKKHQRQRDAVQDELNIKYPATH